MVGTSSWRHGRGLHDEGNPMSTTPLDPNEPLDPAEDPDEFPEDDPDEEEIEPEVFEHLFGLFRSKRGVMKALREITKGQRPCPRVVGIECGKGACFSSQLQHCYGVCAAYRLKPWPYPGKIGVREQNGTTGHVQLHIFQDWCHLTTVEDENELQDVPTSCFQPDFDLDTYKLLQHHLKTCTDVNKLMSGRADGLLETGDIASASMRCNPHVTPKKFWFTDTSVTR